MKPFVLLSFGILAIYCGVKVESAKSATKPSNIPIPVENITLGETLKGTKISTLSANGPIRNVVIEMVNHLDAPITTNAKYYLDYGWCSSKPPVSILGKTEEVFVFRKTGYTATGTTGVVVYKVEGDSEKQFAITFSVPFNYNFASNWFGLKWLRRDENADKKLYNQMYYDKAWESQTDSAAYGYAYNNKPVTIYKDGYIIRATMTDFGRSVLKVDVYKEPKAAEDYDVETPGVAFQ